MPGRKRVLSFLFALAVFFSLFPANAWADEEKYIHTFEVPHGANFVLEEKPQDQQSGQGWHYVPFINIEPVEKTEGSETDTYKFRVEKDLINSARYYYSLTKEGFVKQAGSIRLDGKTVKFPPMEPLADKYITYNPNKTVSGVYFDDGLLMNVNRSSFLELKTGDKFRLKAYRTWQLVTDTAANDFVEPDFHYEVISGDSVTIDKKGLVTAEKSGTSIIRVTYDPIYYAGEYYNPTDPVHTGIVVVNVDGEENSELDTGIKLGEFDTVYFDEKINDEPTGKKEATYSFTPSEGAKVSVLEAPDLSQAVKGNWNTDWKDYNSEEVEYTVTLKPGKNIIKVEKNNMVKYHVIRASGLGINIKNKTYSGNILAEGSTARISFDGLFMPIPKMAAVYNPGYGVPTGVSYVFDGTRIKGSGGQYDFRNFNYLDIPLEEEGTFTLTGGYVECHYMGGGGDHYVIPEKGRLPNFTASLIGPYNLCVMPDITFNVENKSFFDEKEKELSYNVEELRILWEGRFGIVEKKGAVWHNCHRNFNEPENVRPMKEETLRKNMAVSRGLNSTIKNPVIFKGKMKNEGFDIYCRYWKEGEESKVYVDKISGQNFYFDTSKKVGEYKKRAAIVTELITVPKGEGGENIKSYGFYVDIASQRLNNNVYCSNIWVIPVDKKDKYKGKDGILHPEDVRYEDENGDSQTLDFGYGFLFSESKHYVTVPAEATKIKLDIERLRSDLGADMSRTSAKLTVEGNDDFSQIIDPPEKGTTDTFVTDEIPLNPIGDTKIKIEVRSQQHAALAMDYVITVKHREPPKIVEFTKGTDETAVLVKTEKNKTVSAESDGKYALEPGNYKYIASKDGFVTKIGTFTVSDEAEQTVSIPALAPSPVHKEDESVSVSVQSDKEFLVNNRIIKLSNDKEALDLVTNKHFVEYNAGGYTALHAVIDSLGTGMYPVKFNCYKGKLTPIVDISQDYGKAAGWVCEVNGKYVKEPANHILSDGDKVFFYYNKGYEGMIHANFDKKTIATTVGKSVTVKLIGNPVFDEVGGAKPLSGITILDNGTSVGTTDDEGKLEISNLTEGKHAITAEKKNADGNNLITECLCIVKVQDTAGEPVVAGKTTVKFRLIGDAKHGTKPHGSYVTWIKTKKFTFDGDSVSVYDVFTRALDEAGLEYRGASTNYVSKIRAPKAYGGYWLGEFDNGKNSGWMYTVNGEHPQFGLKDFYVTNGDSIVWHYIDDYKIEEHKNTWLEAKDENPPTDKVIDMSKGNMEEDLMNPVEAGKDSITAKVKVEANVDGKGNAVAKPDAKEIQDAIKQVNEEAKDEKQQKTLVFAVSKDSNANSVELDIPKKTVGDIEKSIDRITVVSSLATVSFDSKAVKAIAADSSSDLRIVTSKANQENQENKVANRPEYKVQVFNGTKEVTQFRGKAAVVVSYVPKTEETKEALVAFKKMEDGKLKPILKSGMMSDGSHFTMEVSESGTYVLGYNPVVFQDTEKHWGKSAIGYLASRNVIKGKSAVYFAPDARITRGEFIQILANMSGDDISSFNGAKFDDVAEKDWYANAVAWAVANGIASGTGEGKFSPKANISRQDMSVMISKYVENIEKKKIVEINPETKFIDEKEIASYARDAVKTMQKGGIISGVKNKDNSYNFNPKENATRAEAATMIANYIR